MGILVRFKRAVGRFLSRVSRRILGLDNDFAQLQVALSQLQRSQEETLLHVRRVHQLESGLDNIAKHTLPSIASALTGIQGQLRERDRRTDAELSQLSLSLQHLKELLDIAREEGRSNAQSTLMGLANINLVLADELNPALTGIIENTQNLLGLSSHHTDDLKSIASASAGAISELNSALVPSLQRVVVNTDAIADKTEEIGITLTSIAPLVDAMHLHLQRRPIYVQQDLVAITRLGGWDGHPLAVPTSHLGVLASHFRSGADASEAGVRAVIRKCVRRGSVAIDIGAHVGLHSVIMGFQVGEEGKLICFEPDPELAAALSKTMLLNGYANRSRVINAAVADFTGSAQFHRTPHSPENTLFPDEAMSKKDSIEVEVTSLDRVLTEGSPVQFVKIDAEGAEARIYRGMERTIAENRELTIVVEFAPKHFDRAGEKPRDFLERVVADGFDLFSVGEPDGTLTPVTIEGLLTQETANILLRRL